MCGSAPRSSLFWRSLAAVCVVEDTHQHKRSPCKSPEQSNLTLGMQSLSLFSTFTVSPPLIFRCCFPSVSLLEVQAHLKLGFFLRSQHPCHTSLLPLWGKLYTFIRVLFLGFKSSVLRAKSHLGFILSLMNLFCHTFFPHHFKGIRRKSQKSKQDC